MYLQDSVKSLGHCIHRKWKQSRMLPGQRILNNCIPFRGYFITMGMGIFFGANPGFSASTFNVILHSESKWHWSNDCHK